MQKVLLVCFVSHKIGIGHYSRLLALANTFKKENKVIPEFLIFGDLIEVSKKKFKIYHHSKNYNFSKIINDLIKKKNFRAVIFDIYKKIKVYNFEQTLKNLIKHKIRTISIDSNLNYNHLLDLIWIPSFNFNDSKYVGSESKIKSGWDTYLIYKRLKHKKWRDGKKVLVLTGGSDVKNLAKTFPTELDLTLDKKVELHWVRGPLSKKPILPKKPRLKWAIHKSPKGLDKLIVQSNYVITIFGISFFEILQYGVPSIVFSPYKNRDKKELKDLSSENITIVAKNSKSAAISLYKLMLNNKLARKLAFNSLNKMPINGAKNLSNKIYSLIGI